MKHLPLNGTAVADRVLDVFNRQSHLLTEAQRQQLRERIEGVVNYQAVVGVMGKTGAGKSSLCNALFGQKTAEVDDIAACTRYPQEITLSYKQGKGLALIDMPGVGESEARDRDYSDLYRSMLPELDLVLWLIKAEDRALSIDQRFYQRIVLPYLKQHDVPLLIVVSQSDKIEPCREWHEASKQPGALQQQHLQGKRALLSRLFNLPLSRICAVSAEYGYGLIELVEKIVITLPAEKKWSITRETKPAFLSATTWEIAESGIWDSIKRIVIETAADAWEVVSAGLACLGRLLFRR
jgi:small GTP-binding protein